MKKLIIGLCLISVSGCSFFKEGRVEAKDGRTHVRHVLGFGWNSDNYFYFGDQNSFTDTNIEGSGEFVKDELVNSNGAS